MIKLTNKIYFHKTTGREVELVIDDLIDTVYIKSDDPNYCAIEEDDLEDSQIDDINIVGLVPLYRKSFYDYYILKNC